MDLQQVWSPKKKNITTSHFFGNTETTTTPLNKIQRVDFRNSRGQIPGIPSASGGSASPSPFGGSPPSSAWVVGYFDMGPRNKRLFVVSCWAKEKMSLVYKWPAIINGSPTGFFFGSKNLFSWVDFCWIQWTSEKRSCNRRYGNPYEWAGEFNGFQRYVFEKKSPEKDSLENKGWRNHLCQTLVSGGEKSDLKT